MRIRSLLAVLAIGVAACETVPPTMDPALFSSEIAAIEIDSSAVSSDATLTDMLARTDLTQDQRAEALYLRSKKRFEGKFNVPGALADYDAFALLLPEDPRLTSIERHKVFASSEIENAQRRLAQLQNLSDWFDDKVLMGELDAAAARYRSAGLTPTAEQLRVLTDGGFICAAEGEAVHQFGEQPDYATDAFWCPDPDMVASLEPSDS